jgi:hypothetical protein
MKRLLLAIVMFAIALPAAAQGGADDLAPGPIMDGARELVIEFLDLDADQAAAWDVLWADHRAAEEPIVQQIADVQALIEDLFASGAPDPTELGLLMIERRELGEALIDVHVVYIEGFEFLLDEEQAHRLHEIRIAERIQGFIPAFRVFDLVRRR